MTRFDEVMQRIGTRPALIRMANVSDYFGDKAPYRIENGVALVDVSGPLSNDAWSWGGTTYGEIQDQLKIAAADPGVKGILLCVNSPGGETDNAFETAALVAKVAAQKPMYAVAATIAYSAAYLLASQTKRIYCSQTTGGVGSIGVYCAHFDLSGLLKKEGVAVTLISAGEGKTDGNPYEPLAGPARERLQLEVDRLYGEFVGAVATGRKLLATNVVKLGARLFDGGAAAVGARLADATGDVNSALADLCAEIQGAQQQQFGAKGARMEQIPKPAEVKVPTAAEIETMVAQAREAGFGDAQQIADLCAIAGTPARAGEFISAKKSVADVRVELLKARAAAAGPAVNGSVMPGVDAKAAETKPGTAKPWGEVLKALGLKKEAR